jgi:adenosylhomocysteine nucleosidase
MKILVTFALENEFAPWRARRKFRRAKRDAANLFRTEIGAAEVSVLLTGVGTRQAALEISRLAWSEPDTVEFCISAGFAGALRAQYRVGQVLAARALVAERAFANSTGRLLEGSGPLLSFAEECGATMVDRFYTAERVISRAEEKRALGQTAEALEMESFVILSKARASGVPGIAIRSVSDTLDEDLPLDMNEVLTDEGGVSIPRVLGKVALRPQSIPALVKLGHRSRRAAESLATFVDRFVLEFSRRAQGLETRPVALPHELR